MEKVIVLDIFCLMLITTFSEAAYTSTQTFKYGDTVHQMTVHVDDKHEIVEIPAAPDSDETTIVHDFITEHTAYKDVTKGVCFLSRLHRRLLKVPGLIFKFYRGQESPKKFNMIQMVAHNNAIDIEKVYALAGPKIAKLCDGFPTFRVNVIDSVQSTTSTANVRNKRTWTWANSAIITVTDINHLVACGESCQNKLNSLAKDHINSSDDEVGKSDDETNSDIPLTVDDEEPIFKLGKYPKGGSVISMSKAS